MYNIDQDMMRGFEPLSEYFSKQALTQEQKNKLAALMALITVLKHTYGPVKRLFKPCDVRGNLHESTGYKIDIRGDHTQESHGENYLSASDVKTFQKTGFLGPYAVFSGEEAAAMRAYVENLHKKDFDDVILFGNDPMRQSLKKHNKWAINYSGVYQALRYPKIWDLLASKQITQRMASLMGNDIICWRSQFFEKKPGEMGTFWHQTGTFRELSARAKLRATTPISPAVVQLTAWVALTDVNVANGCMRLIPESFKDGRFERLAYNIKEQANDYLLTLSNADIEKALKTLKFTTGNFVRSQLVYEFSLKEVPDLFQGYTIQDLAMKAGQFVIFSSLNTHGSFPNSTTHDTRLAIAGRYTTNDVKVYDGFTEDVFVTPDGEERFSIEKLGCMQVLGEDKFKYNKMAKYPDREAMELQPL